ncbi:MAG TPA: methylmalonyl Co-A mutase-associated GTPase MeaB, partial [Chloroflexota bacterium]|nr:methylmalonyl Co-A mutase-associated GTPase MeaB [Chloroflexota bacterium]
MTATPAPSDEALLAAALSGQRRALARLLTKVEAGEGEAILHALRAHTRGAHLIGLTGPPGTGKSTLAARMAQELRRRGQTVAIVAVDPSSPLTGGAMLGDRVRMAELAADEGIFVRSMASRGTGGGLAEHTATVAAVLAAAGFQAVLIETVGTGQDEHAVANTAQTTIVITAPGLGDEIQALKAGILELADILVVNQADRDGADQLMAALTLASPRPRAAGSSEFRVPSSES